MGPNWPAILFLKQHHWLEQRAYPNLRMDQDRMNIASVDCSLNKYRDEDGLSVAIQCQIIQIPMSYTSIVCRERCLTSTDRFSAKDCARRANGGGPGGRVEDQIASFLAYKWGSGWWFQTCFLFPIYWGYNNPNWLSYFSEVLKTPTRVYNGILWGLWRHNSWFMISSGIILPILGVVVVNFSLGIPFLTSRYTGMTEGFEHCLIVFQETVW